MTTRQNGSAVWKWVLGIVLTLLFGMLGAQGARIESQLARHEVDIVALKEHCAAARAQYEAIQMTLSEIKQNVKETKGLLETHILGNRLTP